MSKKYQKEHLTALHGKTDIILDQLPDCAKLYFRELRTSGKSEQTVYQYAHDIKGFFDYLKFQPSYKDIDLNTLSIGDILNNLSKEDLLEYIEQYSNKEESYRARKISSLKSFYTYYFENEFIESNKASLLKSTLIHDKNILILETGEIDRLIEATEASSDTEHKELLGQRDKVIISLLASTGIRVSELVGLDISDVDFVKSSIKIVRKGGNEAEIYLSDKIETMLYEYINGTRQTILENSNCPALFVTQNKKRMKQRNVETLISKYAKKAGITKKVTPHTLRRSCGSYLYNENRDIYQVAELLGHRSVETTKKHYAKPSEQTKRDAAKTLNGILK